MTPVWAQRREKLLSDCIVSPDMYQMRTWPGWHHHMALSLLAVWFLIGET